VAYREDFSRELEQRVPALTQGGDHTRKEIATPDVSARTFSKCAPKGSDLGGVEPVRGAITVSATELDVLGGAPGQGDLEFLDAVFLVQMR
jgi:hypothetical protein